MMEVSLNRKLFVIISVGTGNVHNEWIAIYFKCFYAYHIASSLFEKGRYSLFSNKIIPSVHETLLNAFNLI